MFRRFLSLVLIGAVAFAYASATAIVDAGADVGVGGHTADGWGWTQIDEHLGPAHATRVEGGTGRIRSGADASRIYLGVAASAPTLEIDSFIVARAFETDRDPARSVASCGRSSRGPPERHVHAI